MYILILSYPEETFFNTKLIEATINYFGHNYMILIMRKLVNRFGKFHCLIAASEERSSKIP